MTDEEAVAAYTALDAEEEQLRTAGQDIGRRRSALVRQVLTGRTGREVAALLSITPSRVSQLAQRGD